VQPDYHSYRAPVRIHFLTTTVPNCNFLPTLGRRELCVGGGHCGAAVYPRYAEVGSAFFGHLGLLPKDIQSEPHRVGIRRGVDRRGPFAL